MVEYDHAMLWTEDRDLEEEIIRVLLNNVSSC